jgi:hypothetical protein
VKAARLLKEARARGAEVYLKGDHAAFTGQLPDQLVTAMRAAKTEIVAELKREAAAKPAYDPDRLQREANQRNAQAARDGLTDRWCACGWPATFACRQGNREAWKCRECGPTGGTA